MIRHVEGNNPAFRCDVRVVQDMTELAAVGPGGVQTDQRDALAGFFVENTVIEPATGDADIAGGDRLMSGAKLRH